ncbi:iron ABC transporter permease [Azorhizobium oxalatiphilum]|uniref:Iron ABC transporter permease n=1 Tax=Azorhizobium oxalatiphilum TaxID=980631 RepID=A0A917F822_9HYPH|nr:iron chelate uptake ABC transporter family permease subunit [Azorhizobium oxalatiphilum]GGF54598.1 iron ABC transporter permease [Azorhizobium oxalatiphilum]
MKLWLALAILATAVLAAVSLFVGVSDVSLSALLAGTASPQAQLVLVASRVPRTVALILAGSGMAVCGTLMQMIMRNRFVDPSTAGTVEAARFGMLMVLIFAPGLPLVAKMLVAAAFALAGTFILLLILKQVPLRTPVLVPLIGIMLGAVINAALLFIAYRYDLTQSVLAWTMGDFSTVLRGRYEILWVAFALTIAAYVAADQFTVAGLGESFATNLGLNYRRAMALGLTLVAMVTASVVVTVGVALFLGLIVPNLVSLIAGDNLRRTLPWTAVGGAALLLACDLVGRLIIPPYEIPVGTVLGVIGPIAFLFLVLRRGARVA